MRGSRTEGGAGSRAKRYAMVEVDLQTDLRTAAGVGQSHRALPELQGAELQG